MRIARARHRSAPAETVAHIDATGAEAVRELAVELRRDGIDLVVARMRALAHDVLVTARVVEQIREDRFFPTVRAAVTFCVERDAAPSQEKP